MRNFDEILRAIKGRDKKRLAVAMAEDEDLLQAVHVAQEEGIAEAVLVGDRVQIEEIARQQGVAEHTLNIEHAEGEVPAVQKAVQLVREGKAEVLMKGKCSTANFLREILDKESGLKSSSVLSHLAAFEVATYPKLILMSDAALNIAPDLQTKIAMVENAVSAAHKLAIALPRVALITAVEKVNPFAMPCTADAAVIAQMAKRGQIKGAIVDGPLALDNALSDKACKVKGILSEVGGDADILIMPNIETANCFYKTLTLLAGSKTAGIILGAKVPVVLSSRADSEETKFLSMAFALLVS